MVRRIPRAVTKSCGPGRGDLPRPADARLRESFGQAGRRRVLEHFSNERMIRTVERLYLDMLQRAAGRPPLRHDSGNRCSAH